MQVVVKVRFERIGLNGALVAAETQEFRGTLDEVEAAIKEELEHWDAFQVLRAKVRE